MPRSPRSSCSASSATLRKAGLRWLTSSTEVPECCQSGSSARTCSSTSTGSIAGPAAKLNTRTSALRGSSGPGRRLAGAGLRAVLGHVLPFTRLEALDALDTDQPLALAEAHQAHALG